ncbi:xanthine dehydrogenase [Sphingomonas sp. Leaf24]|uniref:xanthine dehydrogenase accessory protein XdhC n=1 Tax=unclassified Sphingomonas TaxID=196159 RepID=UPI0006F852F6|nr:MULTISPECIES: xanthine dehydrogenase accessory protein XdhC [unclassified Sphingomonas]KQM21165.1 xanthine dehydrogenase [Sphingomonas sp. Leaf5]KQM89713.1 xanthine dehydrogenase [Sphingomonas sp. Leaf24]
MTGDWIARLRRAAPEEPVALVTILATEGSAPRGAGTRMAVDAAASFDTIGGGALEHQAIEQARAILAHPPGSWRVQDYPLGPLLGQCCGGRVRLLIERVVPAARDWIDAAATGTTLTTTLHVGNIARAPDPTAAIVPLSARGERPAAGATWSERPGAWQRPLYLFGAGHVGQAIARRTAGLPLRLAWFDSRTELADTPGVTVVDADRLPTCLSDAPDDAAVVILTHDHALDYALTSAALRRPPLAYVGLIGSATKRARFFARLTREGISADARARLTCPIGLTTIPGKEPDVIALSLLAQLLTLGTADARITPEYP